jgi:glycosyltransferase involved in cell wall biosynthesis
MRKVLLIGPYPPPFGGLAVQLCQWARHLATTREYQCEVLNIGEGRATPLEGCLSTTSEWHFVQQLTRYSRQGYLLHLLTNGHNRKSWLSCLTCAAAGLLNSRRTVLVLGSGNTANYLSHAGFTDGRVARLAIKLAGHMICRSESTQRALIDMGAQESRISIMPGFLGVGYSSDQAVPSHVRQFLNDHDPVLGATASNDPEYGIPLMMDALARLRMHHPQAGLVVMGPCPEEVRWRYGPVPKYMLVAGGLPHDAVIVTMKCLRIFLRPTLFDGDSISVREALAMGIPVVASNVGLRPEGVILFPVGDLDGLVETLLMTLSRNRQRVDCVDTQQSATRDQILALYDRLFAADSSNGQTHVPA